MNHGAEGNLPPSNVVLSNEYNGRGAFIDDGGILNSETYVSLLHNAIKATQVRCHGVSLPLKDALSAIRNLFLRASAGERHNKVILIGNGGSSAISSHIAVDLTKNGGIRAIAFNDAPALTCLANDFGVDEIFAKQLEYYALAGDVVVIISSSGKSGNILRAAEQAFTMGLDLVTFSGMNPDNVLRSKGMINFYVPARDYGLVEIAHLALLHSVLSIKGG